MPGAQTYESLVPTWRPRAATGGQQTMTGGFLMKLRTLAIAIIVITAAVGAQADPYEISVNGSFETGDFEGWSLFPTGEDQFTIIMPGSDGDYAACITNNTPASAALMKNANIAIGIVEPGIEVNISFDARGTLTAGGVAFAEFFSELDGGGVSAAEILGGGPLALNADPSVWTSFSYTTMTGPDVSGGVTLQLTATTGADNASMAQVYYDNISITIDSAVPVEATTWSGVKALF